MFFTFHFLKSAYYRTIFIDIIRLRCMQEFRIGIEDNSVRAHRQKFLTLATSDFYASFYSFRYGFIFKPIKIPVRFSELAQCIVVVHWQIFVKKLQRTFSFISQPAFLKATAA